ncbi:transposase [Streptomyces sp. 7R007]
MTEAEWRVVRPLLLVPAWLEERGGRPEGYCHRVMLDAVRYVVDNGVKWANLPRTFRRIGACMPSPAAGRSRGCSLNLTTGCATASGRRRAERWTRRPRSWTPSRCGRR